MSSFYRGSRQDSRDYRERDRDGRSGGGGVRSNLTFRNSGPSRVNPWEGGVAPGMSNLNSRPMAGLLPTPTLNNSAGGLLQQLSTQEAQAQLAIASNMLSALLPTLQSPQPNQVPSLLSLNTNQGGLLSLGAAPGSPFQGLPFGGQPSLHDNLGPNRQKPRSSSKRPEPYNKMVNRNQRPGQKLDDRKGAGSSPHSSGRTPAVTPKKGTQHIKNFKLEDSKRGDARSESEGLEKKRIKEDRIFGKVIATSQSAFADIPEDMFNCHVCNKRMWDAVSFTNHLKGRAHQLMIDQLEENYKIKIKLMRHGMKVEEQQRQIEMQRKQRQGKVVGSQSREYCTMCDLDFIGSLPQHRKSDLHQELKSFIHPKCHVCSKEFSTRLEWDQHQLTPGHLKNASDKNKSKQMEKNSAEPDLKGIQEKAQLEKAKVKIEVSEESPETSISKTVVSSGVVKPDVSNLVVKKSPPIDEVSEVNVAPVIPEYDSSKEIGSEMLQEKTGYLCRCCNRFISSQMDAKTHCRSLYHYEKYISHLQSVTKPIQSSSKDLLSSLEKKEERTKSDMKGDEGVSSGAKQIPRISDSVGKKNLEDKNPKEKTRDDKKSHEERDEEDEVEEDDVNWKRRRLSKDGCDENLADPQPMSNGEDCNTDVTGNVETTLESKMSSQKMEDKGGISTVELDAKKLWAELDANDDLGALLQAVEKDVNADEDISEEKKSSEAPTQRAKRGRGGSAVRSRSRKRK